jgi:hypothetical protein
VWGPIIRVRIRTNISAFICMRPNRWADAETARSVVGDRFTKSVAGQQV